MAKFFGNLHLVLLTGLVLAVVVMVRFAGMPDGALPINAASVLSWLHVFFGIVWIGLLYYLNFVQVPTMPAIPAELKGGVTGYIAPKVMFFFRYGALLTVLTGLGIAMVKGYIGRVFQFAGNNANENLIGLGMWLALIMAFNVWFIIWPAQKKILGLVEASAEEKAAAAPRALYASRTNVLLSIPMLYCMASANLG
ncbi:urate hydroxylase PuuD [Novosphingobium sp.]|uniref:urate hydroxylase PuuD n=1 Tax=Novosphingobium sp. TaxID=1874826 RepID=UPI001EC61800|nr:urate hydroxylase PuuD [Novosphingobium sp.]MBK6800982.1 urate hydroxylase PuuD [Novosphingobium sp.]MBK9011540.1 urate hydroxylase PuuD [Novosphingobium sp.]